MSTTEEEEQNMIRATLQEEEKKVLKRCKRDADCSSDEICAFNEDNEIHYCIPNKLYLGCMNANGFRQRRPDFKSTSEERGDVETVEKCYQYARKLNDNTNKYQYVIYRPRKDPAVLDPKKTSVALMCGEQVLMDFPFEDSFTYRSLSDQQMCVVSPLKQTVALIEKNRVRCGGRGDALGDPPAPPRGAKADFHLEIRYQCVGDENEGIIKVALTEAGEEIPPIQLMCPVKETDRKFALGECTAFGYDDMGAMPLQDIMDRESSIPQTCDKPVYLVPNIIQDLDEYRDYIQSSLKKKSKEVESMITSDEQELARKKALQYKLQFEAMTGKKIDYREAFGKVVEHAETSVACDSAQKWDAFSGMLPLNPMTPPANFSDLDFVGEGLTSETAVRMSACAMGTVAPDYIIYFTADYADATKQNKAYAVSFETVVSTGKVLTSDWSKITGVTTLVNKSFETQTKILSYLNDAIAKDYQQTNTDILRNIDALKTIQEKKDSEIVQRESELDQFINTMNQKIRIAETASDVHKRMIRYIYTAIIILFILALIYVIYQYYAMGRASVNTMA